MTLLTYDMCALCLVNLNKLHVSSGAKKPIVADTMAQSKMLEVARANQPSVCTYGGFGEDRDELWFGANEPAIHLGVDFNNLPAKQSVRSLTDGKVVHVMRDLDKVNGWGGRVIIFDPQRRIYILYGHLDHKNLPIVDSIIKCGDEIGKIGDETENGGWFWHLHLQPMAEDYVKPFLASDTMHLIDGYAPKQLPTGILDPMSIF